MYQPEPWHRLQVAHTTQVQSLRQELQLVEGSIATHIQTIAAQHQAFLIAELHSSSEVVSVYADVVAIDWLGEGCA